MVIFYVNTHDAIPSSLCVMQ
uniref:Uncharacterized protein n=1 Tax=Arundo donax TaxID=35708 RepID=A0A0A9BFS8_ARUDO